MVPRRFTDVRGRPDRILVEHDLFRALNNVGINAPGDGERLTALQAASVLAGRSDHRRYELTQIMCQAGIWPGEQ